MDAPPSALGGVEAVPHYAASPGAIVGGSSPQLVAFVELQAQFPNEGFEPCNLPYQMRFRWLCDRILKAFGALARNRSRH
jgi:hypothetical protein